MTVPSTTSRVTYAGDGSSVAFPVSFYFLANADLVVLLVDADGISTTQVLTTNYTVSGAGVEAGGTVTMLVAPPPGSTLVIYRDPAVTQLTDYAPNDPFPAQSHERALDRLTMIAQRTKELLTRAFRLADSDISGADTTLPSPEANTVIGWNPDANALQNVSPTTLATIVAFGTANSDVFDGDGVTTQFTLSGNPGALNNLDVSIGGVTQTPLNDYTWDSGTTLIFINAPPFGTDNILVRYMQGLPAGTSNSDSVAFIQSGAGAVQRVLQSKNRDELHVFDFMSAAEIADVSGNIGALDVTAALNAAITEALASNKTLVGYGRFKLTSTVNFRYISVDMSKNCYFDIAHAGIGLIVGGNASDANNPSQSFDEVVRSVGADSTTTPTIRAIGVKGQYIKVFRANYFQIYANTVADVYNTDYSSAYSDFDLKYINTIELTNNATTTGSSVQWINENTFRLHRCFSLLINGTYAHNHNKFYNGSFEGAVTINIDAGADNAIIGGRFESGPTSITFGTNTQRNTVECSWQSSGIPTVINGALPNATITDNGAYNQVYNKFTKLQNRNVIARVSIEDPIFNNKVGLDSNRAPYLQRVGAASGTNVLCYSEYQQVKTGDIYEFNTKAQNSGDTLRYRPALVFVDANFKAVSSATGFVSSPGMTTVSANIITTGTGLATSYAQITAAGEAGAVFVRAEWRSSNGQSANGLARILEIMKASNDVYMGVKNTISSAVVPLSTAVPTQSFVPLGFTVAKSDVTSRYLCSFSLDTVTTAAYTAGAVSIVVAVGTGISVNDIIGINTDDRNTHWTTVSSVAGTTIGLTLALVGDAASGSRVVFNRWRTEAT